MPDAPADDPTPQPSGTQDVPTADAAADAAPIQAAPLPPVTPSVPDTGYTAAGVPTFDGVREKIETRFGTALGSTELARETAEGRTAAQQFDARQKAAADKLAEIRAAMESGKSD